MNFPALKTLLLQLPFFRSLDGHMKEVVRGAGVALVVKVLGAGLSFGFNVLLARFFGAEGAGVYFLALTVTTIAASIGRFGLENTLLRFVAAHAAKGDWAAVRGVHRQGMRVSLAVSLSLTLLLFALAPLLARYLFHKPELAAPLRWMSLGITPLALLMLEAEALKGLKRIRDSQMLQGMVLPAITGLGLLLLGQGIGVIGAVRVFVAATIIAALWGAFLWQRYTPHLRKIAADFPLRRLLDSCLPLFWVQVLSLMINWAAMFALGVWGTKAEVGIFGAALRTATLTSFILASVNSIAAPKFAALYSQGDRQGLASTARKSAVMMTAFAAPILLVFMVAPSWVMGIFGSDFRAGGHLLVILAIGQFVNVATGSVGYLLIMSGNERLMRNNSVLVGLLAIVLNLVLVPLFQGVGAAVGTAVSMAAMNLGAMYLVWRKLGFWTIPLPVEKTGVSG